MKVKLNKKNIRALCIAVASFCLIGFLLHNAKVISVNNNGDDLPSSNKERLNSINLIDYATVEDPNKRGTNNVADVAANVVKDVKPNAKSGDINKAAVQSNENGNEEIDIKAEYQKLLSYGPIVLFSKTACPFSLRLKNLLFNNYSFEPGFVTVELDEYPHGPQMQEYLGVITGRRTVPNLIINGVSRGGFDDINALYTEKALFNNLQEWCGDSVKVTTRETPSNV